MNDETLCFFDRLRGVAVELVTIGSGDASQGSMYRGVLLGADSLGVVIQTRVGETWVNLRDVASVAKCGDRGVGGGP